VRQFRGASGEVQHVVFHLHHGAGHPVLAVTDDGPGIPADQRQALFERFTRLDASRSRDAGGTGLGLAIVHDIVTRYRGTLVVTKHNRQVLASRFVSPAQTDEPRVTAESPLTC